MSPPSLARGSPSGGPPPGGGAGPRCLSLDCAIPSYSLDFTLLEAATRPAIAWAASLPEQAAPAAAARFLPITRLALECVEPFRGGQATSVSVFTDGSSSQDWSGWGACLIAHSQGSLSSLVAALSGQAAPSVRPDGSASRPTNNSAELSAAIAALAYLVEAQWLPQGSLVKVHADNALVLGAIWGSTQFRSNGPWAKLLHLLSLKVRLRFELVAQHVRAHTGHPWNEMADVLAGTPSGESVPWTLDLAALSADTLAAAANAATIALLPSGAGPPLGPAGLVISCPDTPALSPQLAMSAQAAPQASASQDVRLQLRIATANVLSLGPEGHKAAAAAGLVETGRTAQLQDSFASQGIQMCGLQETRTKDDSAVQLSRYYAVNSACTSQGHNGCALWVATDTPFVIDGAPTCCGLPQSRWFSATPRPCLWPCASSPSASTSWWLMPPLG